MNTRRPSQKFCKPNRAKVKQQQLVILQSLDLLHRYHLLRASLKLHLNQIPFLTLPGAVLQQHLLQLKQLPLCTPHHLVPTLKWVYHNHSHTLCQLISSSSIQLILALMCQQPIITKDHNKRLHFNTNSNCSHTVIHHNQQLPLQFIKHLTNNPTATVVSVGLNSPNNHGNNSNLWSCHLHLWCHLYKLNLSILVLWKTWTLKAHFGRFTVLLRLLKSL